MCILRAGVAKLVYAPDSKSGVRQGHVGSSPTSGTSKWPFIAIHAFYLSEVIEFSRFQVRLTCAFDARKST